MSHGKRTNRRKKSILVFGVSTLWLLLCTSLSLYSQPLKGTIEFDYLSIEHGLSQSSVYGILHDSKGFMWFGTEDGLNRYDGHNFVVYKHVPSDPRSLSSNLAWQIIEDRNNTIWIGTQGGGLNRYNREKDNFSHYLHIPGNPNSLSHNHIFAIVTDHDGAIWLGTLNGLNRLDPQTGSFRRYFHDPENLNSLANNTVFSLMVDKSNRLWIGTNGSGLDCLDPTRELFTHYPHKKENNGSLSNNIVNAISEDRFGNTWIGTDSGLNRLAPELGAVVRYQHEPTDPHSLSHNNITSIFEDTTGLLWIGTNKGLNVYDRKNNRFVRHMANQILPMSISSNRIRTIYEDRTGVVWIGTRLAGLSKYIRDKNRFTHIHKIPGNPNSLCHNSVWALMEDRFGILWIGTANGLNTWDRKSGKFSHYIPRANVPNSLSHARVWCFLEDNDGSVWVGTSANLDRFHRETQTFTHYNDIDASRPNGEPEGIQCMIQDKKGIFWLGTLYGLKKFSPKQKTFKRFLVAPEAPPSRLGDNFVRTLCESRNGEIWAGTARGLYKFNPETERFYHYRSEPTNPYGLNSNFIHAIHEDQESNLWLGTGGGGLNKFEVTKGRFTHVTTENGLPNDVIYAILDDSKGYYWLSTNQGLVRFNPRDYSIKCYEIRDGLQSNEFNANAYYKSKKTGQLFFGGINGFNAFHPSAIIPNKIKPPIVITKLKVFNKDIKIGQKLDDTLILKNSISEAAEINLSYKHTVFSLEYAGLHYVLPEHNLYAYKMEGLEPDWNYVGNRRFATYANLAPGRYTFKVKGANADEIWNETGTSIKINIIPPFWQTGWFRLGSFILFLALIVTIHRIRTSLIRQAMEKERLQRTLQLKADLTAMLVHDLRSPLNTILGYSELLDDEYDRDEISHSANAIGMASHRMMRLIDNMLDLSKFEAGKMDLEKRDVSLVTIIDEVVDFMTPLWKRKKLNLLWAPELHASLAPIYIDDEKIRQVLTNLLSNSIKYVPEGGTIIIDLQPLDNGMIECSINDTGPGIPPKKQKYLFDKYAQLNTEKKIKGTGLGLAVSKFIIEAHRGTIGYRQGQSGKGSTFYFHLPYIQAEA